MASTILVDKIDPQSGTALEIGTSGDTITVPSGATFNVAGTLQSGGAALANTPAFNVKLSSNQDVSDGVGTVVAFNSAQVDTDSAFNTSTYRFIPQTAGKYFISFTMYALSANAGNGNLYSLTAHIRKNGSNQTQVVQDYNNSFIRQGVATTTAIIDMNGSTDYIDFFGDVNVGSGDGRFENHTRANGFLLVGA
jgi:hypothetical protein